MDQTLHWGSLVKVPNTPSPWGVDKVLVPACQVDLVRMGVLPYSMSWRAAPKQAEVQCEECKAILVEGALRATEPTKEASHGNSQSGGSSQTRQDAHDRLWNSSGTRQLR